MTNSESSFFRRGAMALAALMVLGCSDILEVTDPDIVPEADSRPATQSLRNGVFLRLAQAVNGTQGPDALFMFSGLMADEWRSGDTFVQRNNQDQRVFQPDNTFNAGPLRSLNRLRAEAERAIQAFRRWFPDSVAAIASMFAMTAYAETLMGELYCNGTPLSGLQGTTIIYGPPLANDTVLRLAIANADSALFQAGLTFTGDTARQRRDSTRARQMINLASVIKGRALLDLGQFAAAAAAVVAVPTRYKFHAHHSTNTTTNQVWALNINARRYTIPNGAEGAPSVNFVGPNDPRLPRIIGGASVFDNSVPMTLVRQGLYGEFDSIPIATGIEARLIQAEELVQPGGNPAGWLAAINTMRTDTTLYPRIGTGLTAVRGPTLTALADPGSDTARASVHFRERAFWMFATGHRLGDLRRLMRQYGRPEAAVFPTGAFVKGGTYGDAKVLPVAFDERNNPSFTQCLNQNP